MLWAQSTTKDYVRAEHKFHSISKLFISQVIIPIHEFFLAYSHSAGTQHGNLHPEGWPILHRNHVLATANTGKIGRDFGEKNAGEWTGRVEISKEEIPGSKRSMYGYILTYSRLPCWQTEWPILYLANHHADRQNDQTFTLLIIMLTDKMTDLLPC